MCERSQNQAGVRCASHSLNHILETGLVSAFQTDKQLYKITEKKLLKSVGQPSYLWTCILSPSILIDSFFSNPVPGSHSTNLFSAKLYHTSKFLQSLSTWLFLFSESMWKQIKPQRNHWENGVLVRVALPCNANTHMHAHKEQLTKMKWGQICSLNMNINFKKKKKKLALFML